jgi:cytidine deaminase
MKEELFQFSYTVYESSDELNEDDREILEAAQDAASISYAPYSDFNVGAAAKLANGEIVKGGNQENASFPAGICAEGVVLAVASSQFPNVPIYTLAISYHSSKTYSDHPIAPCGICRQSLQEFKERTGSPVRLIMGGMKGKVFIVEDASSLMPLAFRF